MNLPISESDCLAAISDFAKVLLIVKLKMKQLELNMEHHITEYFESMIATHTHKDANDENIELWMYDLKKQLGNLGLYCRAAALKIFMYLNNYLYILRTPIKKSYDRSHKLPLYNIEFPKTEKNGMPKSLLKELSKLKRKKNLTNIISTCG